MSDKKYTLSREEIIRGYKSFDKVLADSRKFELDNILAFLSLDESSTGFPVKVGFLLSKKKLKDRTIETV